MALQAAINDPKLKQQLSGVISMLKNKVSMRCTGCGAGLLWFCSDIGYRKSHRWDAGCTRWFVDVFSQRCMYPYCIQTGLSAMDPPAKPASTPDPARQAAIAKQLGPEKYVGVYIQQSAE